MDTRLRWRRGYNRFKSDPDQRFILNSDLKLFGDLVQWVNLIGGDNGLSGGGADRFELAGVWVAGGVGNGEEGFIVTSQADFVLVRSFCPCEKTRRRR
ncbi:hypothetical protein L6452_38956 [Arctium lappa]|uniref:Uncharacterized protein n=1 Tax=Arctium lappa TaxID=4217 RepID=A0ACB8XRQ8_ARCLA|nr:hypothetical protein L6452_38956 [Arctium lappa]